MAQLGRAEDLQAVSFKEEYTANSRVLEGGRGNDDSGVLRLEVKSKVKRRRFDTVTTGLITSTRTGPPGRDLC
jgi:hypothetical protein